jgi:hypothetical protein
MVDGNFVKVGKLEAIVADEPNWVLRSCRDMALVFCFLGEIEVDKSISRLMRKMRSVGHLSVQYSSVGGASQ